MVLASKLAFAAEISLSMLESDAYELNAGWARINGTSAEVQMINGFRTEQELIDILKKRFLGKATVTEAHSGFGRLVIIMDIRSDQCPKCRIPTTNAVLDEILRQSIVVSIVSIGTGAPIAIASPAGFFTKDYIVGGAPLLYEGEALQSLRSYLVVEVQSSYRFGRAQAHTALVSAPHGVSRLLAQIREGLEHDGFRQQGSEIVSSEAPTIAGEENPVLVWTKGRQVVAVQWSNKNSASQSKVVIHETITR